MKIEFYLGALFVIFCISFIVSMFRERNEYIKKLDNAKEELNSKKDSLLKESNKSIKLEMNLEEYKKELDNTKEKLKLTEELLEEESNKTLNLEQELEKDIIFHKSIVEKLKDDSLLFPALVHQITQIDKLKDDFISDYYKYKKRPALKASEEISKTKKELREKNKEFLLACNRVNLYESLAPWLVEYEDMTLDDLINAFKEERKLKESYNDETDPTSLFISKLEWTDLSVDERNQLALERYANPKRKKTLWQVGIDYERYVGYYYEQQGYSVKYNGALKGKEDLGIDLICTKGAKTLIVQCKRLSQVKEIPVRENVIAQTFGASKYYGMDNKIKNTTPVIITSYKLSDKAKEFAEHLKVEVIENFKIDTYPLIKCNISKRTNEKIYHLPLDQQYDSIIIGDNEGEFYASTVNEAVSKGFRRAYKWKSR